MERIYYLLVVFFMAFIGGMLWTTGRSKRNYLRALTILFVITVVGMNPAPYHPVVKLLPLDPMVAAVQPQAQTTSRDRTTLASPASFTPIYVYKDKNSNNRFIPSGYMPNADCLDVEDAWFAQVKEGRTCMRFVYDTGCSKHRKKWAGLYWQNPANNWGSEKGGYNLTGATKLIFWARGEEGGEIIKEFKVGGLGAKERYPDSATVILGPVTLTKEWKEYAIDLRGKDVSFISGGFAWSTSIEDNPDPCIFYLDDIRFE